MIFRSPAARYEASLQMAAFIQNRPSGMTSEEFRAGITELAVRVSTQQPMPNFVLLNRLSPPSMCKSRSHNDDRSHRRARSGQLPLLPVVSQRDHTPTALHHAYVASEYIV